jgi:ATP-dependent helicase STH1/SNF2
LDRVLPKLLATGHRVLIFNQFKLVMDYLEIYLENKGYKFLRMDGETKVETRTTLLETFNQPNSEYDIFIISTRSGGQGFF